MVIPGVRASGKPRQTGPLLFLLVSRSSFSRSGCPSFRWAARAAEITSRYYYILINACCALQVPAIERRQKQAQQALHAEACTELCAFAVVLTHSDPVFHFPCMLSLCLCLLVTGSNCLKPQPAPTRSFVRVSVWFEFVCVCTCCYSCVRM